MKNRKFLLNIIRRFSRNSLNKFELIKNYSFLAIKIKFFLNFRYDTCGEETIFEILIELCQVLDLLE